MMSVIDVYTVTPVDPGTCISKSTPLIVASMINEPETGNVRVLQRYETITILSLEKKLRIKSHDQGSSHVGGAAALL